MIPTDRASFKERILQNLGKPVIRVNLADVQLENAVDDALAFWTDFHMEGTRRTYLRHQMTQEEIDANAVELPGTVLAVNRVLRFYGTDSGNATRNIFSPMYQLRMSTAWEIQNADLTNYVLGRQHLAMLDDILNSAPQVVYKKYEGLLRFDTTLNNQLVAGDYICAEATVAVSPTEYPKVWGDKTLRALATAYARRQWGLNMSKHEGITLPGGVTLNGPRMVEIAEAEIEKIETDFQTKWSEPPMGMIG